MSLNIHIVGAGSFAKKLALSLNKSKINVMCFVDEFTSGYILDLPVIKANQIPGSKTGLFLIAISNKEHTNNAVNRLISNGVQRSSIIPLHYESCILYLESCFQTDHAKTCKTLQSCNGSFSNFEEQISERVKLSNHISIRLLSRGSLFLDHLYSTITALRKHKLDFEVVSDRLVSVLPNMKLRSQEGMLNSDCELVITSQFYEVASSKSVRLTFVHAIYDSMMFRDSVFESIDTPKHHYLAIPSQASMDFFSQKLQHINLKNPVTLIPYGYPKLVKEIKEFNEAKSVDINENVIIYAPTQTLLADEHLEVGFSLFEIKAYLIRILELFPNFKIIIQPHPDDLVLLKESSGSKGHKALNELLELCNTNPRVSLISKAQTKAELLLQSSFLISDTSSTAYSYAFTTLKPVLFISPNESKLRKSWSHLAYIKDRNTIGTVCASKNMLEETITSLISEKSEYAEKIKLLRSSQIYLHDSFEKNFLETIKLITRNQKKDNWVSFN